MREEDNAKRKEGNALNIREQPDIENPLRTGVNPNAERKEALRARLFHGQRQLRLDDLENVTGGAAQGNLWELWDFRDERFFPQQSTDD